MRRLCYILVGFLTFSLPLFAKNGGEHITDMYEVLPFYAGSDTPFKHFYECIQGAIDYKDFNPDKLVPQVGNPTFLLQEEFQYTIWGGSKDGGAHRIWFHWGFNKPPKEFEPLRTAVKENISKGRLLPENEAKFWNELGKERNRRNLELMRQAAKIFGYPTEGWSSAMRAQLNGFVTIPYSVHLLGDHFEGQSGQALILDMKSIVSDVYNAIDDLAGKEPGNRAKAKDLKSKLSHFESSPEAFLDELKKDFSPFLLSLSGGIYDYKKKFRQLGYTPRPGSNLKF